MCQRNCKVHPLLSILFPLFKTRHREKNSLYISTHQEETFFRYWEIDTNRRASCIRRIWKSMHALLQLVLFKDSDLYTPKIISIEI